MTRTLIVSLLLFAALAMSGCGSVAIPAHAQSSSGSFWTAGSGAAQHGPRTIISAEGNLDATNGLASLDLPIQVVTGSVTFQGTLAYRAVSSGCSPQALMVVSVDGQEAWRAIVKTTPTMTAVNLFLAYSYPVSSATGQANLHVESDGGCKSDFEIQGAVS
jgi:hypothetical protein